MIWYDPDGGQRACGTASSFPYTFFLFFLIGYLFGLEKTGVELGLFGGRKLVPITSNIMYI